MRRFRTILIILLGLAILLLGLGVWLKLNFDDKTRIPNEQPAIVLELGWASQGTSISLFIYPDGTVIYSKETGQRTGKPSMIWKKGQISSQDLEALIAYFKQVNFAALDDIYKFPGIQQSSGSIRGSDMMLSISVNYAGLTKIVHAIGYISEDNDASFIDLPDAFNKAYQRLMLIAETRTKET